MKNFREKILYYGTFFLVSVLPVLCFSKLPYPYSSSKIFFLYGSVEILTFVWIYNLIVDKSYKLYHKDWRYFIPVLLFVFWMTLAGVLALSPLLSFWSSLSRGTGLLTLYHILIFVFVVVYLVHKRGLSYVHTLMKWFIGGGFILALSIWFGNQGFNFPLIFLREDAGGGLSGNSSVAASYLMFILFFGVFLLTVKTISKKEKWLVAIAMAVILFSPIFINIYGLLTGTGLLGGARGATLGIIVAISTACLFSLSLSSKKISRSIGIAGIIISIVIFSYGWKQLVNPDTVLHHKFIEVAGDTRFTFWDTAQSAMREHPWFGYGPESYSIAYNKYLNTEMFLNQSSDESWADKAHNMYYDTGVSGGYPAIALYAFFILSILYVLYIKEKNGVFTQTQASVLGGLIVGYVFQNLFFFDTVLSLVALFTLAGIVYGSENIENKANDEFLAINHRSALFKNFTICILILGLGLSLIFFVYEPIRKAKIYFEIYSTPIYTKSDVFANLSRYSKIGEQWDVGEIADFLYKVHASNQVAIKNNPELLPIAEENFNTALSYLSKVARENPYDYQLYISVARLYVNDLSMTNTPYDPLIAKYLLALLSHAHDLSPKNPEVYFSMADVYSWSSDINNMKQSYLQAIQIDPRIPISHQKYLRFLSIIRDKKLYKEELVQAKHDVPGFVPDTAIPK